MRFTLPLLLCLSLAACSTPTVGGEADAGVEARAHADAGVDADGQTAADSGAGSETLAADADATEDATPDAAPEDSQPADRTTGAADAVPPPAEGELELWFWNLWSNGLFPDNRAKVVAWAPQVIFFSDAFEADDHALLQAEADYAYGFHTGENFAVSSQIPCADVEVIHHEYITKRLLRCQLPLGDQVIDVFELHLKNPTKSTKDQETQAAEVLQVLAEIDARTGHVATVLIGDFNSRSSLDGETELVAGAQSFLDAGYTDTWKLLHPDAFEPTKIARSFEGSRIDYAFVSPDLVDQVVASGIEQDVTYPENSDHRPVWVRLSP